MAFELPAGWYHSTISHLVDVELPEILGPLNKHSAWRYVYAIVYWAETHGGQSYLHINDRLSKKGGQVQALRAMEYFARHFVKDPHDPLAVIDHIGKAYNLERVRQGHPAVKRDPNTTGTAFETALQVILERICGVRPSRTPQIDTLQGFELAPKGYHSRPDLALFTARDFRLLISTKWTLRKERIGTYLHEAHYYKRRRPDLQVAFVLSEFSSNILQWLSNDPLVDRVYHVHLPMLLHVYEPFKNVSLGGSVSKGALLRPSPESRSYSTYLGLRDRVFDLSVLFDDVDSLRQPSVSQGPEAELDDTDDLDDEE